MGRSSKPRTRREFAKSYSGLRVIESEILSQLAEAVTDYGQMKSVMNSIANLLYVGNWLCK